MVAGEDKGRQIPATHLGKPLEATFCQSSHSLSLFLLLSLAFTLSTPRLKTQNANDKTVSRLCLSGLGQLAQVNRAAAAAKVANAFNNLKVGLLLQMANGSPSFIILTLQ